MLEIKWTPPDDGWVKLDVDGASRGNPGEAGCGGLMRDATRRWLGDYTCNFGICNALTAEIWGALNGLHLAWELGFRKVILKSDSRVMTTILLKKMCTYPEACSLLFHCSKLLLKE